MAMATPRSGGTMPRTHHVVSRPLSPGPPGNRDNQDCPQETWCWGNPRLDYRVTLASSPHPAPGLGHPQLLTRGQPERALDQELSPSSALLRSLHLTNESQDPCSGRFLGS